MSKYIIEIAEEYDEYFKGVLICGIADGKFAVDVIAREDLEELNSDYINEHYGELQEEAYQRGYDEGYKKCLSENDFDQPCVFCDDYQSGLDEAMSAFKKLYSCGWERDWKAMGFEFDEGEWGTSFEFIIGHYTAAEIVEKVKAYEDKQKDRIEVGDEVKAAFGTAVVTYLEEDSVGYLYSTGTTGFDYPRNLIKTGKHYDIASILEAMRTHD